MVPIVLVLVAAIATLGLRRAWAWAGHHVLLAALVGLALAILLLGLAWLIYQARQRAQLQRQKRLQTLQGLRSLSDKGFEMAVGDLLRQWGHRKVQVCGGAGDRGADILSVDASGRRWVVQCKRYSGTVGSPTVQTTIGARQIHRADHAMIATTGTFTSAATALGEEQGLTLLHGERLVKEFIAAYGPGRAGPPAQAGGG